MVSTKRRDTSWHGTAQGRMTLVQLNRALRELHSTDLTSVTMFPVDRPEERVLVLADRRYS